jgi:hypothetical protein
VLFAHFPFKRWSFYQDRLGTNIGKVEGKVPPLACSGTILLERYGMTGDERKKRIYIHLSHAI